MNKIQVNEVLGASCLSMADWESNNEDIRLVIVFPEKIETTYPCEVMELASHHEAHS